MRTSAGGSTALGSGLQVAVVASYYVVMVAVVVSLAERPDYVNFDRAVLLFCSFNGLHSYSAVVRCVGTELKWHALVQN